MQQGESPFLAMFCMALVLTALVLIGLINWLR